MAIVHFVRTREIVPGWTVSTYVCPIHKLKITFSRAWIVIYAYMERSPSQLKYKNTYRAYMDFCRTEHNLQMIDLNWGTDVYIS